MRTIQIIVEGVPIPQGSMRAFVIKGPKPRAIVTADNKKTKPWRDTIAWAAKIEMEGQAPAEGVPVVVDCWFGFVRPKSTKLSVGYKTTKPDIDKLARAVLDALTGVVFKDDSQVISLHALKFFDDIPHAKIQVSF